MPNAPIRYGGLSYEAIRDFYEVVSLDEELRNSLTPNMFTDELPAQPEVSEDTYQIRHTIGSIAFGSSNYNYGSYEIPTTQYRRSTVDEVMALPNDEERIPMGEFDSLESLE